MRISPLTTTAVRTPKASATAPCHSAPIGTRPPQPTTNSAIRRPRLASSARLLQQGVDVGHRPEVEGRHHHAGEQRQPPRRREAEHDEAGAEGGDERGRWSTIDERDLADAGGDGADDRADAGDGGERGQPARALVERLLGDERQDREVGAGRQRRDGEQGERGDGGRSLAGMLPPAPSRSRNVPSLDARGRVVDSGLTTSRTTTTRLVAA